MSIFTANAHGVTYGFSSWSFGALFFVRGSIRWNACASGAKMGTGGVLPPAREKKEKIMKKVVDENQKGCDALDIEGKVPEKKKPKSEERKMTNTTQKISIWIDSEETIIVSSDDAEQSTTLREFDLDEMSDAREFARAYASERGLQVVVEDPTGSGQWRDL